MPFLVGVWAPDAGYFPHLSWQLKRFIHSTTPSMNLFYTVYAKKAFQIGWKIHMICDELIHSQPFFSDNQSFCPPIPNARNLWLFLQNVKKHLGREIGLDLFLLEVLPREKPFIFNIIKKASTYLAPKIHFHGFKMFQSYISFYITTFLPALTSNGQFSKRIRSLINYDLFKEPRIKKKIIQLIEKAKIDCKAMVKSFLASSQKQEKLFNEA